MNNEEKVKEIAHNLITAQVQDDWWYPRAQEHYEEALMEMAKWKDEQFSKFLLWLDDHYVIRRFTDGETMTYAKLIDNFKSMEQQ